MHVNLQYFLPYTGWQRDNLMKDKGTYSLAIVRTFYQATKIEDYRLYMRGTNEPYRSKRLVYIFRNTSDIHACPDCMDHLLKIERLICK
jgi:hypothetical protein